MCAACIEYSKLRLTLNEFKSALREAAMDDPNHLAQVEELIKDYADKPEELARLLKPLQREIKDY